MGLSTFLLSTAMQRLPNTSYKYLYGVAVNPKAIHVELKVNPYVIKKKFVDLPTFEMPDGSRPFKNFDFKDKSGTRVMFTLS